MKSSTPVLNTIREILKFKDYTTIAEVASISGLSRKQVLDVVNRNGAYVYRVRTNGRITKVDTHTPLRKQLWESGQFYKQGAFGAWSVEGHSLDFHGNDDLRKRLEETRCVGGLGDNYNIQVIIDTPENRAAIEQAGLRPWSDAVIDDRLWQEEQP